MGSLTFNAPQMALIRRTVAKDCDQNEFDLYIEMCKARGLNPLLRHCYAFVFSKNKPSDRQMVIVVSIDGQRSLAERTGSYRPDERAPRFESVSEKDHLANPHGLTSAEVTVYKHSHGEWFPVTAVAYWDEVAPLKEIWENDKPTGRYRLDPKKDAWRRMPRVMLAKCFSSDTEVLTSAGFQKFSELSSPVMQVTDAGLEPVSVTSWSQPYSGDMITLDSDDLNFCVTPNHEMVTTSGRIEAQKLYNEARCRPSHYIPRIAQGRRIDADITDEALVLAAAYISDGYDRSGISFVIPVSRERKVNRLRALGLHSSETLERASGSISHTETRDILTKTDKTVFKYRHADMGGMCQAGKRLDAELLVSLSERQARLFVEAWIEFDGNITSAGVQRFYCSNEKLMGAFELAACMAGKTVSYRRSRTSDISERPNYWVTVSDRDAARVVRWGRDYNSLSRENEQKRTGLEITQNTDGLVWCVSVPSQTIIVRRNGFSMVCGNCAEMAALRKAFPDDFSGLYGEGEMDRAEALDLTPSEAADDAERQDRLARIGGRDALTIDWLDGNELPRVPAGKFADQCMAFLKANKEEPMTIRAFQDRNRHAFREFWALCPSDALALKKEIEKIVAEPTNAG